MLKKISLLRDRVNDSTSGLGQARRTGNNPTQAKTGLEWATRARPSPRAPGPLGPSPAKGVTLLPSPYTTPANPRQGFGWHSDLSLRSALLSRGPLHFALNGEQLSLISCGY